jgi:hypothetical protein
MTVTLSGGDDPVAIEGDIYIFRVTDPATQTIVLTYGSGSQEIDLGGVTSG